MRPKLANVVHWPSYIVANQEYKAQKLAEPNNSLVCIIQPFIGLEKAILIE